MDRALAQYMWPFALIALLTIPFSAFSRIIFARRNFGSDEGRMERDEGGIVYETLTNIRTIFALSIEEERLKAFEDALEKSEPGQLKNAIKIGVLEGTPYCPSD